MLSLWIQAGEALAETLQSNVVLKDVDVSCNQIGPQAATSLRAAVDSNWVLERLEVTSRPGFLRVSLPAVGH